MGKKCNRIRALYIPSLWFKRFNALNYSAELGGSPGLVFMGFRGFESRRRLLDGHNIFPHIFVVRIVMFI